MKATLRLPMGEKVLSIEGQGTPKEIIKGLSFWASLPTKCSECDGGVNLYHKAPKGKDGQPNDYYGLRCAKCGAELNFGQHRTGDNFFLKSDARFVKWEREKTDENSRDEHADDESRDLGTPF